jgi:hypothetical protein
MSSITQLNSQENNSLPTQSSAFISQLDNNSSIHPMPGRKKTSTVNVNQKLNISLSLSL